jgi:hypothetical protein
MYLRFCRSLYTGTSSFSTTSFSTTGFSTTGFSTTRFSTITKPIIIKRICTTTRYLQTSSSTDTSSTDSSSKPFTNEKLNELYKSINDLPYIKDMVHVMKEMEKQQYNTKRLKIILSCIVFSVVIVFYDLIRNWTSKQVTNITTRSLEDEEFQKEVGVFCEKIIMDLAKRDDVCDVLAELFAKVFVSKPVIQSGADLSGRVVKDLLNDKEFEWLRQMIFEFLIKQIIDVSKDKHAQLATGHFVTGSMYERCRVLFGYSDNNISSTNSTEKIDL